MKNRSNGKRLVTLALNDSYYPDLNQSIRAEAMVGIIDSDLVLNSSAELLQVLKNIVSSAPIVGLPLALEKDIQAACALITKLEAK